MLTKAICSSHAHHTFLSVHFRICSQIQLVTIFVSLAQFSLNKLEHQYFSLSQLLRVGVPAICLISGVCCIIAAEVGKDDLSCWLLFCIIICGQ